MLGTRDRPISILPNDLSLSPESVGRAQGGKAGTAGLTALTSGYFVRRKNLDLLLKVFYRLGQKYSADQIRLIVAGDGPALAEIKIQSQQYRLANIEFLGWQTDLTAALRCADIYLHPAFMEGMSNSILDALGASLPVLASRTAEIKELLEHEELLFDPQQDEELAGKLEAVLSMPGKLERWREMCRKRAAAFTFDWDEAASRVITARADVS